MAIGKLSSATYVERGYGQVEPNHLSAQRTGQIYAQLPAKADINVLENGQFVKYNYKDGVVDFSGAGEWMLVYNAVKLYRDHQENCEFAMIKSNYAAQVYSPVGGLSGTANARDYSGVVTPADPYDPVSTNNPFVIEQWNKPQGMPYVESEVEGETVRSYSTMVPRVFKTNVGDIYTTNTIKEATLTLGELLTPGADGFLTNTGASAADMQWQVVKLYTLPDRQKAAKLMRIK